MCRVNSYKLLTSSIGKDENGNDIGASLDEFRIQRVIGTGAYAVVKLATHEVTNKRVALKIYSGKMLDAVKRKAIWQEI
jgi:serine/threonine protein kinase